MVGMAFRALPMRVGFCHRGVTQGIALSQTTFFGVAMLLLLDFRQEEAEATLLQSLGLRGVDLMPGFAGQSRIESNLREEDPTLRMRRVGHNETFGCTDTCQLVLLQRKGKGREIGMRRTFPGIQDARLGTLFATGCPKAGRVGDGSGREGGTLPPCLLGEAERAGRVGLGVGRCNIVGRTTRIRPDQFERFGPVFGL